MGLILTGSKEERIFYRVKRQQKKKKTTDSSKQVAMAIKGVEGNSGKLS